MDHVVSNLTLKRQWFITSKTDNIEKHYQFDSELGKGAYGRVFKAYSLRSGQVFAIKEIQKARLKDQKTFRKEMKVLKELDHPQIIKAIETYETELMCYLVTDYCDGGELFDRIVQDKALNEERAAQIMRKLFSAVSYCHKHDICHRDIKPENILMISSAQNSDIKLIDFGLAKRMTEKEIMHSLKGTPYYIAPEIILQNYTEKVDCWSLGVILYILLCGFPPFHGNNNEETLMRVLNSSFSFNYPEFANVSPLAKDLIGRLLIKDPEIRLSSEQAFNHLWIKGYAPLPTVPLSNDIYVNINSFMNAQKLKRATLMFIASKINENQIDTLRNVFMSLDIDGDGMLSRTEFDEGIAKNHMSIDNSYLDTVWNIMDTNENGRIDYSEFLTACMECQQFVDDAYLRTAFEFFDRDLDGRITIEELRTVLNDNHMGTQIGEAKLETIIREVDTNNDGNIDYMEFMEMMRSNGLR